MKYQQKRFSLPAVEKPPEKCQHTEPWLDKRGRCVQCGEQITKPDEDAA